MYRILVGHNRTITGAFKYKTQADAIQFANSASANYDKVTVADLKTGKVIFVHNSLAPEGCKHCENNT